MRGAAPEADNGAVAPLPPREVPAAVRGPPAARAAMAAEPPLSFYLCSTHRIFVDTFLADFPGPLFPPSPVYSGTLFMQFRSFLDLGIFTKGL
jgi:hypothetical protein